MSGDKPILKFKKVSENASAPQRASNFSAGYDLRSAHDYCLPPSTSLLVDTDIQVAIPDGYYGRVAPRSGLALKHFVDVGGGVIDQDYRGNVGIILFNFGTTEFKIAKGDRVAQLICEKICYPDLEEVQCLDETSRGSGGFGSSGIK